MRIVIIGSGMAGITLAEELHKLSPETELTVLTGETHGYYSRPMLSHGFSREDIETKIILKAFDDLRASGIAIESGAEVLAIDRATQSVTYRTATGQETGIGYDRLALAPGSDAFVPPPFRAAAGLYQVVNSLDDLLALRRQRAAWLAAGRTPRWAIIGGGLIGCEVASDLAKAGDAVVLFHALPRLMERQLVEEDSATLLTVLQKLGVEVRLDSGAEGFETQDGQLAIRLADGPATGFDGILVACGFKPRTALAEAAGLTVKRGVAVDGWLRTSDPAIFALGDAAECEDGRLYAYVMPIRQQALWLAQYLAGQTGAPWQPPIFKPRAKVHGFTAAHPYLF